MNKPRHFVLVCLLAAIAFVQGTAVGAKQNSIANTNSAREFSGLADYYHHKLYGQKTASGQVLQKHLFTAAHPTLPFGTKVKVTNKCNGSSCVVVINDRGPYTKGKVIDLSHAAAVKLGAIKAGTVKVACRVVDGNQEEEED
jgi:rare lipoprotein A